MHHAEQRNLKRAKEAADAYRADPDADFHAIVGEMTSIVRDDAKSVNFAKAFGARVKKFAEMTGKPLGEAQKLYAQYDAKLPFVSQLSRLCQNEARSRGYTVLYDGARRHWNLYEAFGVYAEGAGPCHLDEARRRTKDPEHPWFRNRCGATRRTPPSTRSSKAPRHDTQSCGCWPSTVQASSPCCSCMTPSSAP